MFLTIKANTVALQAALWKRVANYKIQDRKPLMDLP